MRYQPTPNKDAALVQSLTQYAQRQNRRGYRKAWDALWRKGQLLSKNRVHRLWKRAKLQVKPRKGKKRKPPDARKTLLLCAVRPRQVWSVDFIFDALANSTKLKMLTVGDDFPRACLAIEVGTSFVSNRVLKVLDRLGSSGVSSER